MHTNCSLSIRSDSLLFGEDHLSGVGVVWVWVCVGGITYSRYGKHYSHKLISDDTLLKMNNNYTEHGA